MLKLSHLTFQYEKDEKILDDISFTVELGESVGIIGVNGVGKSTLLKILIGLNLNYQGQVFVDHLPVKKEHLSQIRKKLGYVFQDSDSQLFMSTVWEDIAFGVKNYGYGKEEVEQRVSKALELVKISSLREKQIYKLSGGEKKLVSIATILAMEPQVILLDEPSIALDPRNRRNLIGILNDLPKTKVIASHDLDMILDTCERTILLSHGTIVKDGNTKEVLSDQTLLEQHGLELPLCMQRCQTGE